MEQGYGGVYSCSLQRRVLKLTLGPVLHYALPAAPLRGTAKGVSVVYLCAIQPGSLFMVARCGAPERLNIEKRRRKDVCVLLLSQFDSCS